MAEYGRCQPVVQDIDPTVLAQQRELNKLLSGFPIPDMSNPGAVDQLRTMTGHNPGETELVPIVREVDADGRSIAVRIFVPSEPRAVLLRIHGGGWAAGAPQDDDVVNDQYARELRAVVISPEYRLVPEHPQTAQVEDCIAVMRWVAENSLAEFGTDRLLIGGASAGAHLAASALLDMRHNHPEVFARIEAALLDCGSYDLAGTPSVHLFEDTPVLNTAFTQGLLNLAFPGLSERELRDPALSPMFNDLRGLPPAIFVVGDLDPLRDESVLMSLRWHLAGSEAQLDVWPEAAHAFTCMGTPLAVPANARIVNWLSDVLARRESPRMGAVD